MSVYHTQPAARRIAAMAWNIGKVADKHAETDSLDVHQVRSALYLAADLVEEGQYAEADNSLFEAIEVAEDIDWLARQVATMRDRYSQQIQELAADTSAPDLGSPADEQDGHGLCSQCWHPRVDHTNGMGRCWCVCSKFDSPKEKS